MDDLYWNWGFTKGREQWFIRVQDLDKNTYAMAYYSTDDKEPLRFYESTDPALLELILQAENTELFSEVRDMRDMALELKDLKNVTIANFM